MKKKLSGFWTASFFIRLVSNAIKGDKKIKHFRLSRF